MLLALFPLALASSPVAVPNQRQLEFMELELTQVCCAAVVLVLVVVLLEQQHHCLFSC